MTPSAERIAIGGNALGLQLSYTAMATGYSREMEHEADKYGLQLMAGAAYGPREMTALLRMMLTTTDDRAR